MTVGEGESGRYFQPEIETMPRVDLESLQEDRLAEVLPLVYEHSQLVRTAWDTAGLRPADVTDLDDLKARAPFLSKASIWEYERATGDPWGGMLSEVGGMLRGLCTTSGTTGDPVAIPIIATGSILPPGRVQGGALAGHTRGFWEWGVRPGDYFAELLFTFRGPVWANSQGLGAIPVLFDHSPAELERFCRVSLDLRPTGLWTLSGPLVIGLQALEERTGVDLKDVFSSYRGVSFAGEGMSSRARAALTSWGVEVFESGSAGDVESTMECREHAGQHFAEDWVYVEVIRPDGTPAGAGETGEMVVTSLDPCQPLVRFRTDDLVSYTSQPCECGRTHGRVWILGRTGDETVVAGKSVMVKDVTQAVEVVPETSTAVFQIIRAEREVDRLRLRVGYVPSARSLLDVRTALEDIVEETIGLVPEVELVPMEELLKLGPPHKIPRIAKQ